MQHVGDRSMPQGHIHTTTPLTTPSQSHGGLVLVRFSRTLGGSLWGTSWSHFGLLSGPRPPPTSLQLTPGPLAMPALDNIQNRCVTRLFTLLVGLPYAHCIPCDAGRDIIRCLQCQQAPVACRVWGRECLHTALSLYSADCGHH